MKLTRKNLMKSRATIKIKSIDTLHLITIQFETLSSVESAIVINGFFRCREKNIKLRRDVLVISVSHKLDKVKQSKSENYLSEKYSDE